MDPVWLWLWHRLAAGALIRPLAWELPYTAGAALKSIKKKKKILWLLCVSHSKTVVAFKLLKFAGKWKDIIYIWSSLSADMKCTGC